MTGHAELVRELKSLRKGRGILAGRIEDRVGPILREACEVTDDDALTVIRQKVAARLTELAEHLPDDLRLATLAAYAIHADARQPLYQDRVRWAAVQVDRDPRTVRRRVDEAIAQLADLAVRAPRTRPGGVAGWWHTTELRVAVALDKPQPEVLETRRIVADRDGLRELDLAVSLPVAPGELEADAFYGGTLRPRGMETTDRIGYVLTLPRPLSRGESHDFTLRFRLPATHPMRPYMVCVPRRPCELFELWVRFAKDRQPPRTWMLHGAFQRDVQQPTAPNRQQLINQSGEIHLRFRQLTPGLAYGARWDNALA
jgi:hypothetical protein